MIVWHPGGTSAETRGLLLQIYTHISSEENIQTPWLTNNCVPFKLGLNITQGKVSTLHSEKIFIVAKVCESRYG